jgi:hypothetical protein
LEYYNISTLGNYEELGRLATDTASLVTLYYKEQIQSIDTSSKIEGSNIFNDKIKWIKDNFVDVRPEGDKEMPVIIVDEYVTAWIVGTALGGRKNLDLNEPIPQQLWLCVAQVNCVEQGIGKTLTDVLGTTDSRQKIPLKIQNKNGAECLVKVQLRHLIGCPSVVTDQGNIYQYDMSKEPSKKVLAGLNLYGYVYPTPFVKDKDMIQLIIKERNLSKVIHNNGNDILIKLKDIEQYVQPIQNQGNHTRKSAIAEETARHVAQILREDNAFVDPKDVKTILDESKQEIELCINVLREDIQEKIEFYQTSIDATSEKLQNDFADAQQVLKTDNGKHYSDALKTMNEKFKQIENKLEANATKLFSTIEKQLKIAHDEMRKIVEEAKNDSNQALIQLKEAAQASKLSAEHSKQAHKDVIDLSNATEQRQQEFQIVMARCEANINQTIVELKDSCEQSITAVCIKAQQDLERIKQAAEQSAINAKESSQAAKESARLAQETQKDRNKIISDSHEITRQNERLSKEANEQVKQITDTLKVALRKIDEMERKLEHALDRLEN